MPVGRLGALLLLNNFSFGVPEALMLFFWFGFVCCNRMGVLGFGDLEFAQQWPKLYDGWHVF